MRFIFSHLLFFFMAIDLHAQRPKSTGSKYLNFISPSSKSYFIQRESEEIFQVKVLNTDKEIMRGFSGVRPEQVEDHQGLFFNFKMPSEKYFWMPNTYFDLAIIYLDKNMSVINKIDRAPHHVGTNEENKRIYRAPPVFAHYVLEFKATSEEAKKIKLGDKFRWVRTSPNSQRK